MKIETTTLVGAILAVIASATSFEDVVSEEWNEWKAKHGKRYPTQEEEELRLKVFMDNKETIANHNSRFHRGSESYSMELNHLSDQLKDEMDQRNGYDYNKKKSFMEQKDYPGVTHILPAHVYLPEEVDWRRYGAVTKVKNQGSCGSCWAFAATGALEGQTFRKSGELVSLSEQQLIDCSYKDENDGCHGGVPEYAFKYIKEAGGLDTEKSYPYRDMNITDADMLLHKRHHCHFNPRSVGATDKGWVDIKEGDEYGLQAAVALNGPVTVAIRVVDSFKGYSTGIYESYECHNQDLNHAVLVIGYGSEWTWVFREEAMDEDIRDKMDGLGWHKKKVDYWLVKNSWGEGWGEDGYVKIRRGMNMCGIADMASHPLV